MKPINEKERTVAFVQFLVLFILTIILTIFFVFFNHSLNNKVVKKLREDNRKLKESQIASANLPDQLDSLKKEMKNFDKLTTTTQYDREADKFIKQLSRGWEENNDSSQLGKIKTQVFEIIELWKYDKRVTIGDKGSTEQIRNLQSQISQKDKDISDLDNKIKNHRSCCTSSAPCLLY